MIKDMTRSSKWPRHKDRYIGRLYLDTGMVSGEIENISEHREVIGTPREVYGPYWALVERREKEQRRGAPPQAQSELGRGPAPLSFFPPLSSFPLLLLIGKGGQTYLE